VIAAAGEQHGDERHGVAELQDRNIVADYVFRKSRDTEVPVWKEPQG
jgi:hypothetical protein